VVREKDRAGSKDARRPNRYALAPTACAQSILRKETSMDLSDLTFIYNLLYAIGEILATTWPGRLILGMAVGSVIAWLARL
jgi:hypothetical protein